MKTLLALLLLSAASASAQFAITNTVKVSLTVADDNALRLAWKLDSNSRTNGLAPYASITNALTYGQYQDWLGTEAFKAVALKKHEENRTSLNSSYLTASDADKAKAHRVLSGLAN